MITFWGSMRPQKISDSLLEKNWPRNNVNANNDPYEAPVLPYIKEMDQLVEANTINSKVKKEDYETCPNGKMTKLDDKEESTVPKTLHPKDVVMDEEEDGTEPMTTRIEIIVMM